MNQRHNQADRVIGFADDCIVDSEQQNLSTPFLHVPKNQLVEIQENFKRYCNVLPVSGFNSPKHDLNLIKSYLVPIHIYEQDLELTVIKKANRFVSFKFGDIQLLHIVTFLVGAGSLVSFHKAYRLTGQRSFSL